MRRLFVHVDHGGDDVLTPHEAGEEFAALLEKAPLFFWWQTGEERQVGSHNQAAEHDGVFAHGLGQIERLDSVLHGTGVVAHFWLVQVEVLASLIGPDVGVGTASPLAPVMALDVAKRLALELINMKDEV